MMLTLTWDAGQAGKDQTAHVTARGDLRVGSLLKVWSAGKRTKLCLLYAEGPVSIVCLL